MTVPLEIAAKAKQARAQQKAKGAERAAQRRPAGQGAGAGQGEGGGDRPPGNVSRGTSPGGRTGTTTANRSGGLSAPKLSSFGKGRARKALVAEFLVCVIILALSPLSGKHGTDDVHAWIRRWFGISGLFFFLGLMALGGDRLARIAAASGLIVTAALVANDSDVFINLFASMAGPKTAHTTQSGGGQAAGQLA